jgi:competence protein ComEC
VLAKKIEPVTVLMAPHHGSKASNTPELAKWAQPQMVISNQGLPRWNAKAGEPYEKQGARFLTTWWHGAVTVRSEDGRGLVETYRTQLSLAITKDRAR